MDRLRFLDVDSADAFRRIPPCADRRFDHRTCDYWEDADRGSKAHRPAWLEASAPPRPAPRRLDDNPFAPAAIEPAFNPFDPGAANRAAASGLLAGLADDASDASDPFGVPSENPFAPRPRRDRRELEGVPRKVALLLRGEGVFGSYAKVALHGDEAIAYAQFGPLSAYPRAARLRDLYRQLPAAPLPAVITCISSTAEARRQGHALALVQEVCADLARRGFAAVESYPDLTRDEDEQSGGRPAFWERAGFSLAVDDERFPVMRRELD